jgi:hypothetical protein
VRPSLERALVSWRGLITAWHNVFEAARMAQNWERMALAEAKLDQCKHEVERLEQLLRSS